MGHYDHCEENKRDEQLNAFISNVEEKKRQDQFREWEEMKRSRQAIHDDPVNHPKHYTNHPSGIECIQITEHMNFCIGNCVKYLWRAGLKEGSNALEDLKKAQFYINREIQRLER